MSPKRRPTSGLLWEVIAPWVRWPLHSPRRLFTIVTVIVLAFAGWHALAAATPRAASTSSAAGLEAGERGGSSTGGSFTPTAGRPTSASAIGAASAAPTTATPAQTATPAGKGATPEVPAGSGEAAEGFVTAWARPSLTTEQWLAGVRGYVAPTLQQALSYTDPAKIPASHVTGPSRMVHVVPDGTAASFDIPTNAGPVRVGVALLTGRWLVTDIVPASASQPGD